MIKYIKSVLWRVAKCLSYIEEVLCLTVNVATQRNALTQTTKLRIRTKAITVHVMELVWLGGSANNNQHVNHYNFEVLSVTNVKHTVHGLRQYRH